MFMGVWCGCRYLGVGVGVGGQVTGICSVLLPADVPQGECSAQVRDILDVLYRRRHENLAQHRADRDG